MSLKTECIVIIERIEDLKTNEFKEEILNNSPVMFYSKKKGTKEINDGVYLKCIILKGK